MDFMKEHAWTLEHLDSPSEILQTHTKHVLKIHDGRTTMPPQGMNFPSIVSFPSTT